MVSELIHDFFPLLFLPFYFVLLRLARCKKKKKMTRDHRASLLADSSVLTLELKESTIYHFVRFLRCCDSRETVASENASHTKTHITHSPKCDLAVSNFWLPTHSGSKRGAQSLRDTTSSMYCRFCVTNLYFAMILGFSFISGWVHFSWELFLECW